MDNQDNQEALQEGSLEWERFLEAVEEDQRKMPTISEPKDLELFGARASQYRAWYLAGMIGEETYRASLMILGLRDQDLTSEINLAKMERRK